MSQAYKYTANVPQSALDDYAELAAIESDGGVITHEIAENAWAKTCARHGLPVAPRPAFTHAFQWK